MELLHPNNHERDRSKRGQQGAGLQVARPDGGEVALSNFAGQWIVLYFYPRDDTPGCTVEACDFTAGLADFEKLDAVVLGCSPDSPESHRKFIAKSTSS